MSLELTKLETLITNQNAMIAKQNQMLQAQGETLTNLLEVVAQLGTIICDQLDDGSEDDDENFGYDLSGKPIPN